MLFVEGFERALQVVQKRKPFGRVATGGLRGDRAQQRAEASPGGNDAIAHLPCARAGYKIVENLLLEVRDLQAAAAEAAGAVPADQDVPLCEVRPFSQQLERLDPGIASVLAFANLGHLWPFRRKG